MRNYFEEATTAQYFWRWTNVKFYLYCFCCCDLLLETFLRFHLFEDFSRISCKSREVTKTFLQMENCKKSYKFTIGDCECNLLWKTQLTPAQKSIGSCRSILALSCFHFSHPAGSPKSRWSPETEKNFIYPNSDL